jgi:hypothetical protein
MMEEWLEEATFIVIFVISYISYYFYCSEQLHIKEESSTEYSLNTEFEWSNHQIDEITSFDDMNLKEELLRGIYASGIDRPSYVQQVTVTAIDRYIYNFFNLCNNIIHFIASNNTNIRKT